MDEFFSQGKQETDVVDRQIDRQKNTFSLTTALLQREVYDGSMKTFMPNAVSTETRWDILQQTSKNPEVWLYGTRDRIEMMDLVFGLDYAQNVCCAEISHFKQLS